MKKFLPLILFFLTFGILEFIFKKSFLIYYLSLFLFIILLSFILIILRKKTTRKEKFLFSLSPFFFLISFFSFILFEKRGLVFHLFVFLASFVLAFYLRTLFLFFHRFIKYETYSLENISNYTNLLSVFFFSSALLASFIFLNLPLWLCLVLLIFFVFLLLYQLFWVFKIELSKIFAYFLILVLILGEAFLAITFLPTSYYIGGGIFTIIWYILVGLSRQSFLGILSKKLIFRYLTLGILMLILILATAQWI